MPATIANKMNYYNVNSINNIQHNKYSKDTSRIDKNNYLSNKTNALNKTNYLNNHFFHFDNKKLQYHY